MRQLPFATTVARTCTLNVSNASQPQSLFCVRHARQIRSLFYYTRGLQHLRLAVIYLRAQRTCFAYREENYFLTKRLLLITLRTLSNGICRAFGFVIANNVYKPVRKALYRLGSTKHLFNRDLYLLIRKEGSVYKACSLSSLVILTGLLL